MLLEVAWLLSTSLKRDPDDILDWRASKVALWAEVADRQRRTFLHEEMVLLSHAVWAPDKLGHLLGDVETAEAKSVTAADAIAKAEKIIRMRTKKVSMKEVAARRGAK